MSAEMIQRSPIILSLATAQRATAAALHKATEWGVPFTITVIDGAGHLVQSTRMDGAVLASIETSFSKARTAAYFAATTLDLASAVADGEPLATIQTSISVPFTFVAGGIPIADAKGVVIGAIGAGGGSPAQDHEIALVALAAL
ncbi:heme-binding protein [Paraburkholderia silviterrae]|nr:heme-binding protein [Paraburkholderia silviterrae]